MKYKESIIKVIKALVFCLILVCMINVASGIMERKTAIVRIGALFEDDADVDVLFFGTSHVRFALLPMELWNSYGITSHDIGGSFATQPVNYWSLVNVLDYVEPELVVIDCYKIAEERRISSTRHMHEHLDAIPMSVNKLSMICDLMDNWNDRLQFIWKFSLYHNRWSELTSDDFQNKEYHIDELAKGSTAYGNILSIPETYTKLDKSEKLENTDTLGVEYLRKSIEECQSRGIDVLLIYLPFPANEEQQREANTVYDIANEYGVKYINFLDMDLVNYDTDCRDVNSHLNLSGAYKVTDYVGGYIMENYDITDHREDTAYASWNNDYESYTRSKIDTIKELTGLETYLISLADDNLSSCIYIDEKAVVFHNEVMTALIGNLSQYVPLKKLEEAAVMGSSYFLIVDNGEHTVYESVGGEAIDIPNTTFGHVEYGVDDEGRPYLYIQDGEENYLADRNDAAVAVINKYTGAVEDVSQFNTYGKRSGNYGTKVTD